MYMAEFSYLERESFVKPVASGTFELSWDKTQEI